MTPHRDSEIGRVRPIRKLSRSIAYAMGKPLLSADFLGVELTTEGCEQLIHHQMERAWLRSKPGRSKHNMRYKGTRVMHNGGI